MHVEAYRPEQSGKRAAHGRIVVDDEDDGPILAQDGPSSATGSEKRKTAPRGSFGCPTATRRAMALEYP